MGRHVYPRAVVSVGYHYINPTRGVGLVQSGSRRYLIQILFSPWVNLKIVHLAFNNNSHEHRGDHIWCPQKTVDGIRFKLFFRHRCFVDLHKYPILLRRQYTSWLPSYMHIWYIVVTFICTKVVIHVARCAWYNIYVSSKTDTTIQRYIFWLKWHFARNQKVLYGIDKPYASGRGSLITITLFSTCKFWLNIYLIIRIKCTCERSIWWSLLHGVLLAMCISWLNSVLSDISSRVHCLTSFQVIRPVEFTFECHSLCAFV